MAAYTIPSHPYLGGSAKPVRRSKAREETWHNEEPMKEARYRWWTNRQSTLAAEINEATGKHSWRQLWSAARRISQSLPGPGGRVFHQVPSYFPTTEDWLDAMQRPAVEGGCRSKTVWRGDMEELHSFLRMGQLALAPTDNDVLQSTTLQYRAPTADRTVEQSKQDFRALRTQFQRRANGFATPL
ncbi:unnamed protein product [Polarella glacialis]|uniref:Uncharacterized protein n=1 Tax=Polarella glacialis TaxID=89957 RepID=A0A813G3A6_POLGL|nr:unnamed protein product [Polarella glacialis]